MPGDLCCTAQGTQPPLDGGFIARPIAHRGWHTGHAGHTGLGDRGDRGGHGDHADHGPVENTAAAFEAAIARGYGIECDVQAASDGLPVIFHDATTGRLCTTDRPVASLTACDLKRLNVGGGGDRILTLQQLLELTAGRVPLVVEIKSDWTSPDQRFIRHIATALKRSAGPVAVMSFDPAMLVALRQAVPEIPRGLVATGSGPHNALTSTSGAAQADRLANLLDARRAGICFVAYDVRALPTPVTAFVREVLCWPLLAWTVRTSSQWQAATHHADAAIFEGQVPASIELPEF